MVHIFRLLAILALAGCAVTPERASQMSERELCIAWMSPLLEGTDKSSIYNELQHRNVPIDRNCPIHWENSLQLMSLGAQMMNQSRQPPPDSYTECYKVGDTYRCNHYGQTYYNCYPDGTGYRCQ